MNCPGMLNAIVLDFTVKTKEDVNQDTMFVMMTMIVVMIQMKINKSLTVVSAAQSFLYQMIS